MEKKLKHLEFIQGAVGRMASNLFLLKGWTITLIAALFALAAKSVGVRTISEFKSALTATAALALPAAASAGSDR